MRPAALVTGSTDGIGVTTAKHLAAKGVDIFVHGRDARRVDVAKRKVEDFASKLGAAIDGKGRACPAPGRVWPLPPSDLATTSGAKALAQSVQALCEKESLSLSILVHNAGVFSEDRVITSEGMELTFAVNVVAPFVVTSLLLPLLLKQKSRIVIASSISQGRSIRYWEDMAYRRRPYSAHAAYSESKLLVAALSMEMAARLQRASLGTDRITCNCLDPGTVNTKMLLSGWGPCGIDVEDALDETWLCTSDEVETKTGRYFVHQMDRRASEFAYDERERARLWTVLRDASPEAARMWAFNSGV
jgi:NAD(P)-dependent dehydrogenase (short-subunit alcohol dehydrogenase family)